MTGSASSEEDMDLDVYDDDIKVGSEGSKTYEVDYKPLTHQQVKDLMVADVDYISTIFGVEVSLFMFTYDGTILIICIPRIVQSEVAGLLLRHLDWNKDRLTEKYMDNASSISIVAGVFSTPKPSSPTQDRSKRVTRSSKSSKKSFSEPFLCPICFDDAATDTLAMSCGHAFCTGCWAVYAVSKIRDEGEHRILCMAENCGVVALDSFVHKVLSEDQDTAARYDELLVRNYVACNKNLKYCPFPSCDRSVSCPSASSRSALSTTVPTVSCGADPKHKFCFGCNIDGDHRPVLCTIAKMWLKKCRDDSETANWIKSNTKECSKCQSTIEKNGGCKYVFHPFLCTIRGLIIPRIQSHDLQKVQVRVLLGVHGYDFATHNHDLIPNLLSTGPWAEHGTAWYSCNRYDDKSGVDARDAQSKSRASLERYLHVRATSSFLSWTSFIPFVSVL